MTELQHTEVHRTCSIGVLKRLETPIDLKALFKDDCGLNKLKMCKITKNSVYLCQGI